MTAFYGTMSATALAKLVQFGQTLTIKRYSNSTPDYAAGSVTRAVTSTGTLTAVVLPASKGTVEAFDNRMKQDTSVNLDKLRFVIAAASGAPFEPKPMDEITFESRQWRVLGCTPLNPAGTALLYKMGVQLI